MKIHLDLDCYFVSAERTRYPYLKHKNVVVVKGGDKKIFSNDKKEVKIFDNLGAFNSILEFKNDKLKNNDHGIVIAKSYEAKKYGIKTGDTLKHARFLCKDLIVIPCDHLFYQEISQKLKLFLELRIPILEQYSIDEFFGDLKGYIKDEDVYDFIKNLQSEILCKFDLPITIGANKSKWIAKLITNKIKPYGVKVLKKDEVNDFINDININEFPGIGKSISKKLNSSYIKTLGEARKKPYLFNSFGKTGIDLYKKICGIDNEEIIPYKDRRSIGISRNFSGIDNREEIKRRVAILARYLSYSIQKLSLMPSTFYFKIKYDYGIKSSKSISQQRFFNEKFLITLCVKMVEEIDIYPNYKIHYIGISSSNFINKENQKIFSLFEYEEDLKQAKLSKKLLSIRNKYGIDMIKWGIENK